MAFNTVSSQVNFPELEKEILSWWYSSGLVNKYLHKNDSSSTQFSFLDGPITANNPMGVHHAWGRTYKDLWQRYHTMKGDRQRYQNGFDCQGLWVEVEVEKDLGFRSKKDIETYGVAEFVQKCKDRVIKYSNIQTDQSKRLGYFMDWENSYFTMSDQNNYAIWNFLKVCHAKKWLYKGHDVVTWCPRCETAISQHETLTEDYKELTHDSVFLKFPITNRTDEFLLIWTTTPWTLPANTAVSVDPKLEYSLVGGCWVATLAIDRVFENHPLVAKTALGSELVGLHYTTAFDDLPAILAELNNPLFHTVIATDNLIMPISTEEGTGLVHTSTSTGEEDHKLGLKIGLPVIPAIADNADYLSDFGWLAGKNAKKHPEIILDFLKDKGVFKILKYTHRYPACWRCKSELVWKVADEWYISMDKPDESGKTFREQMISVAQKINWLPDFGLSRELDWLNNMHDWLISKKNRYWGLALPIYECQECGQFEVLGSKEELEKNAISGWDKFIGHTPHKPWIDEVRIKCSKCGESVSRISDVGNPWLDAGIVSISTMSESWFPADFITESFPGQFKNWFYSLIAMATVLKKSPPFKNVLGYNTVVGEDGRPMHKSWGNSIEFNEGADKIGVDVMRWIYASQNPTQNLLFGYKSADEVRRKFHLILWNIYNFFITYANIDNYVSCTQVSANILDKWILVRLDETITETTTGLEKFDAYSATRSIENFVSDLSLWYVRRSRDRVGPTATDTTDKLACHSTLYQVLVTLSQIMAPITPFMSESIYKNLTGNESVHLSAWPKSQNLSDPKLILDMQQVRKIAELGLSERKLKAIKVRQPLSTITVHASSPVSADLEQLILDELNVKKIIWEKSTDLSVVLDTTLTPELIAEGQLRELIRSVQELRKSLGARIDQQIKIILPEIPTDIQKLKDQTLATDVSVGTQLQVELI